VSQLEREIAVQAPSQVVSGLSNICDEVVKSRDEYHSGLDATALWCGQIGYFPGTARITVAYTHTSTTHHNVFVADVRIVLAIKFLFGLFA
jgi:hypothetical protein